MAEIDLLIARSVEESEASELKPFALDLDEQQMKFASFPEGLGRQRTPQILFRHLRRTGFVSM